jgi:hypothetical protein
MAFRRAPVGRPDSSDPLQGAPINSAGFGRPRRTLRDFGVPRSDGPECVPCGLLPLITEPIDPAAGVIVGGQNGHTICAIRSPGPTWPRRGAGPTRARFCSIRSCLGMWRTATAFRSRGPAGQRTLDGMSDVTRLLEAAAVGDPRAAAELLPLVYDELRKLAATRMAEEKPRADPPGHRPGPRGVRPARRRRTAVGLGRAGALLRGRRRGHALHPR